MKQLTINGWNVQYEISVDGRLKIGFHSAVVMQEGEQQQTIELIGKYLITEGFVELPGN